MLLKSLADTVTALKEVVDTHGKRPLYVLTAVAVFFCGVGFSFYPMQLELRKLKIVDRDEVSSAKDAAQKIDALRFEVAGLETRVHTAEAKAAALQRERDTLERDLTATQKELQATLDALLIQRREAVNNEASLRQDLTLERSIAQRKEAELKEDLRKKEAAIGGMLDDAPSLTARGLWDRNRPSLRAFALADALPSPLQARIVTTMKGATTARDQLVEIIDLLDQYAESRRRCEALSATARELKAAHARGQSLVIKSGETVARTAFVEERAILESTTAAEACLRELSAIEGKLSAKVV